MRAIARIWWTIHNDRRGMAATEFALVAPFLILLYVGSFQLADAIAASRKVTVTTRSLADLTSQYISVSTTDIDVVLKSASKVITPYDATEGTFIVTHITTNGGGHSKVDWSRSYNGKTTSEGYAKNTKMDLPSSAAKLGSSIIRAEVSYEYRPYVAPSMLRALTLTDTIYMLPRRSSSIARN
jgi:Flp pilus assembly protein TadG